MADTWVTVPFDELVRHRPHDDGIRGTKRCTLCNAATVPNSEETIDEQIRIHMQRKHSAIPETVAGKLPEATVARLVALGWTPPVDISPEPEPAPDGGRGEIPRN